MDAAEVLPCWSTVTTTLSMDIFSLRAVPCMIRMLAWCGISQSISASVSPALAKAAWAAFSSTPTASLKTACPSILRTGSPRTLPPDTLPGTHKISTCLPSACKSLDRMPGVSEASSTTAPAPSPNNTQVVRSLKSRMRLKTSAPITRARLAAPVWIMESATDRA